MTRAKPLRTDPKLDLVLERVVDVPRERVWAAWTEPRHIKKWFTPAPWKTVDAEVDLRPGGTFLYCLQSPDGYEMWGKWVYREITPPERLVTISSFTDAQGNQIRHPAEPHWPLEMLGTMTLAEHEGKTTVTVQALPHSATDEESKTFFDARDSMEEGFTGTFDQLADYLAKA